MYRIQVSKADGSFLQMDKDIPNLTVGKMLVMLAALGAKAYNPTYTPKIQLIKIEESY